MQVSEIEDRLKIHDLFARYMRSVDNWDEAELYACFTEDGVLESPIVGGRFVGREGQRQFMINGRKMGEGRMTADGFSRIARYSSMASRSRLFAGLPTAARRG